MLPFIGFGKHRVPRIHHGGIIQNSLHALEISCAPPRHPSLPSPSLQAAVIFPLPPGFAFPGMPCSWNRTVCL